MQYFCLNDKVRRKKFFIFNDDGRFSLFTKLSDTSSLQINLTASSTSFEIFNASLRTCKKSFKEAVTFLTSSDIKCNSLFLFIIHKSFINSFQHSKPSHPLSLIITKFYQIFIHIHPFINLNHN